MNDVKLSAQILDIDEKNKTILVKELNKEQNEIPCKLNIKNEKREFLKIGQNILIEASVESEKFMENGNLNYSISIVINNIEFLGFSLEDDFI